MLETIQAMSLLGIMEIVGPILLAVALIYGSVQWRRRSRTSDLTREAATRRLYREASKEERLEQDLVAAEIPVDAQMARKRPPAPDPKTIAKVRSGREGERPSEDDLVREHLGPRGRPGEVRTKVLDEDQTQTPKPLDPGHTA